MLDKSNADTEMASSLMGHYGAEKVANMLAAAAKDPKTETIATNLEGGLIRFWKGLDTEPTEVFNILKLENKVDDVFDIPALAMWASYLKVYNEKHPAKPVSMTGVFAKYYGGETAFLKMLAKADDADSAGAKKLQNEVITAFRIVEASRVETEAPSGFAPQLRECSGQLQCIDSHGYIDTSTEE
ncbi:hypothetical protein PR001_g20550 [Phytophthora rubi]|uniref:RxLR effector protein n=1 Tax=Phytophthora rubi TaxID=129364 RepID=A0A6A3JFC0_9STRA|nr:hypothetical protein PR001_g20550 [Phytophthora rubi]